ncbi:MAG: hypothetical protein WA324_28705 [Bryobacteraceae bacterium]
MHITNTRQHVHSLIDRLQPAQLTAIEGLLSVMLDPGALSFRNAPVDDEPLSEEEEQAIRRSEEWFRQRGGKGIPMEEILAEFGLSMNDFPIDQRGVQD